MLAVYFYRVKEHTSIENGVRNISRDIICMFLAGSVNFYWTPFDRIQLSHKSQQ